MEHKVTRIYHLSVDAIAEITKCLHGPDSLHLWFCGNASLNLLLGPLGGITRLDFQDQSWGSTSRWPRFIGNCLGLRILKVIAGWRPLGPTSLIWSDLSLLKRLSSIHLQFLNAEQCFMEPENTTSSSSDQTFPIVHLQPTMRDIGAHFPNLSSMKIFSSVHCIDWDCLSRLPSTLTEFRLTRDNARFNDADWSKIPFFIREIQTKNVINSFSGLPTHIERLKLANTAPLDQIPPSVTHLTLKHLKPTEPGSKPYLLPDTIESLELDRTAIPGNVPKSLTSLKMQCLTTHALNVFLLQSPSTLTQLSMPIHTSSSPMTAEQVLLIPRSVLHLEALLSLQSLIPPAYSDIKPMPTDGRGIEGQNSPSPSTLPPGLQTLRSSIPIDALPFLPVSLTAISMDFVADDVTVIEKNMHFWPPNVTWLAILTSGPLCAPYLHLLPKKLRVIHGAVSISSEVPMDQLPLLLRHVFFNIIGDHYIPNVSHFEWLKSLALQARRVTITKEFCRALPHRLESLEIDGYEVKIDKEAYSVLPKNLKSLLIGPSVEIPIEHYKAFPRDLKLLSFNASGIKDEQVQFLPPNLTDLNLMQNTKLTKNCIPFLPWTLSRLACAQEDVIVAAFKAFQLQFVSSYPDPRLNNPNLVKELWREAQLPH